MSGGGGSKVVETSIIMWIVDIKENNLYVYVLKKLFSARLG